MSVAKHHHIDVITANSQRLQPFKQPPLPTGIDTTTTIDQNPLPTQLDEQTVRGRVDGEGIDPNSCGRLKNFVWSDVRVRLLEGPNTGLVLKNMTKS